MILAVESPKDGLDAAGIPEVYRQFHNAERANPSLAYSNHPPYEAFPELSALPSVPPIVNPAA
jgi:hypothetical protein